MKKSYLKTNTTEINNYIDIETGELIDVSVNKTKYLANSKEEFYITYSSIVLVLKGSKDVKIKLLGSLMERYSQGQEFSMTKSLKQRMANDTGCSYRSIEAAFTYLVKENIVVKIANRLYVINPRHVFQGSVKERNNRLKAVIELGCKDC